MENKELWSPEPLEGRTSTAKLRGAAAEEVELSPAKTTASTSTTPAPAPATAYVTASSTATTAAATTTTSAASSATSDNQKNQTKEENKKKKSSFMDNSIPIESLNSSDLANLLSLTTRVADYFDRGCVDLYLDSDDDAGDGASGDAGGVASGDAGTSGDVGASDGCDVVGDVAAVGDGDAGDAVDAGAGDVGAGSASAASSSSVVAGEKGEEVEENQKGSEMGGRRSSIFLAAGACEDARQESHIKPLPGKTAFSNHSIDDFNVGDPVLVLTNSGEHKGTVKFAGKTQFATGEWLGVALDAPVGKHSGTVKGVKYFKCEADHGVFSRAFNAQKRGLVPVKSALPKGKARPFLPESRTVNLS